MTYLELPSGYGFPYVARIPLGLTTYRAADSTFLHSVPVPEWIDTAGVPPGGISDPRGTWQLTEKALRAIARAAAHFGPF